jgi:hypothetical protein
LALQVIGAGVGRTGTYSLKLALEMLGFGPCHHMEEVLKNGAVQVPPWAAAVAGKPDWAATFAGYNAAVDWPSAAFWPELSAAYPDAKVILSTRDPERWYDSYSKTIETLLQQADRMPTHMKPWAEMAVGVTVKSGSGGRSGREAIIEGFKANEAAVKRSVPADRLLVFQASEGWQPLCAFLNKPVPADPFPRTNDQAEFWELVKAGIG